MSNLMGPPAYWAAGAGPGDVRALAARLSRVAAEIDDARARLGAATTLDWRSKAAEAFRQETGQRAAALAGCASDVKAASACVAAYGRALEALTASAAGTEIFGG